jgi:hypothetical protein
MRLRSWGAVLGGLWTLLYVLVRCLFLLLLSTILCFIQIRSMLNAFAWMGMYPIAGVTGQKTSDHE